MSSPNILQAIKQIFVHCNIFVDMLFVFTLVFLNFALNDIIQTFLSHHRKFLLLHFDYLLRNDVRFTFHLANFTPNNDGVGKQNWKQFYMLALSIAVVVFFLHCLDSYINSNKNSAIFMYWFTISNVETNNQAFSYDFLSLLIEFIDDWRAKWTAIDC